MDRIRAQWGAAIKAACATSTVPESFLAALIAGESGGDTNAKRFEPAVLGLLWQVLMGRKADFGDIGGKDLDGYVISTDGEVSLATLDALACSWGLTQIMGYNVYRIAPPARLQSDPEFALVTTLRMLGQFAQRFGLDLANEPVGLFTCWNAGSPDAKTTDPHYAQNGVTRMALYASSAPPAAVSA